jgi:hypothetical protein
MAYSNQYTAGTAPTLIIAAPAVAAAGPVGWWCLANGSGGTVYIGGPNVSSANGAAVAASTTLTGFTFSGDRVYVATASGTSTVGVLQTGA